MAQKTNDILWSTKKAPSHLPPHAFLFSPAGCLLTLGHKAEQEEYWLYLWCPSLPWVILCSAQTAQLHITAPQLVILIVEILGRQLCKTEIGEDSSQGGIFEYQT